jgi:hypothetical protein
MEPHDGALFVRDLQSADALPPQHLVPLHAVAKASTSHKAYGSLATASACDVLVSRPYSFCLECGESSETADWAFSCTASRVFHTWS